MHHVLHDANIESVSTAADYANDDKQIATGVRFCNPYFSVGVDLYQFPQLGIGRPVTWPEY